MCWTGGWLTALLLSNPCVGTIRKELWLQGGRLDSLMSYDIRGPSLVLKKGCLHQARLWYTPLVEVNQAIFAWSFRQLKRETARGPGPPGNEIHFNQVKSGVAASQYPVTGGLCAQRQEQCYCCLVIKETVISPTEFACHCHPLRMAADDLTLT